LEKAGEGQRRPSALIGYPGRAPGYARMHNGKQFEWVRTAIPQERIQRDPSSARPGQEV